MTSCRTCKSRRLYRFLRFGSHPLANAFLTEAALAWPEPRFPLDAYACLDCGLIQVRDQVPADFFRHYVYMPSAAETMHAHFAALADLVAGRFLRSPEALTIDIGCNDGLFLRALKDRGGRTLGIDPATNIARLASEKGLDVVNEYFGPDSARQVRERYGPAAVIVTTNTFHHIGDLDSFTEGVRLLLDDDGVLIIEVPHALDLIEQNEFDGVYHEHVSQLTVKSLVDLFRRFDLEVVDIERLAVHGGSMRVFVRRGTAEAPPAASVQHWIATEAARGLFTAATYDAFRERVERNRDALVDMLRSLKRQGKRVAGYGASARGNTLLNYCRIGTDLLDYLVDRNPLKHGLWSPGMRIPIHGIDRLREDRPDYLLLVAWNFAGEIMRQQADYARTGGRFILPIPQPVIISGATLAPA